MFDFLRNVMIVTTAAAVICGFTGCVDRNQPEHSAADDSVTAAASEAESAGSFTITLRPDVAPITCENFEKLVSEGFYDGLTFHRVVDDFMAQGGNPNGDGTGGAPDTIEGEFSANGHENNLSHKRGVVSMARSQDMNSASSQFFICYSDDDTFLDGNYAAFGEVTEGMEVVDSFLEVERLLNGNGEEAVPKEPITITKAEMIDADADGHPRAKFDISIG
jgi:peptidyl-prolyl cis-trans isomerase B (cyclophilin B)